MEYTPQLKEAINHLDGNLQIIAYAGSAREEEMTRQQLHIYAREFAATM